MKLTNPERERSCFRRRYELLHLLERSKILLKLEIHPFFVLNFVGIDD